MTTSSQDRWNGALFGGFIGDALAMPVHWYYNRSALHTDYGQVCDYQKPINPHPDSILWRSSYDPPNDKADVLHDQARYWGQRGVHYHQFLQAGENTFNLRCCHLLASMLVEKGEYETDAYLTAFIGFALTPGRHRDTYVEEYVRHFFTNYAHGKPPRECGVKEKHIGGLASLGVIAAFYADQPETARDVALHHLSLTHKGSEMETAAQLVLDILLPVLAGESLKTVIEAAIARQANPLLGHPFSKWLAKPDDAVIGRHLSPACYVQDSVPAVIYLALKYHDDPEQALIVNTNLGGDNAYRGAVLGAIMGAAHGLSGFPQRWVDGLIEPPPRFD